MTAQPVSRPEYPIVSETHPMTRYRQPKATLTARTDSPRSLRKYYLKFRIYLINKAINLWQSKHDSLTKYC